LLSIAGQFTMRWSGRRAALQNQTSLSIAGDVLHPIVSWSEWRRALYRLRAIVVNTAVLEDPPPMMRTESPAQLATEYR